MFKKIMLAALLLFVFATNSFAQMGIPYVKTLENFGFTFDRIYNGETYHSSGDVIIVSSFRGNNTLLSATIGFNLNRSTQVNVFRAMYIVYLSLQTQLGKDLINNTIAGERKMRYLVDTIAHNLELSNTTRFKYDDLTIFAMKKDNLLFIKMGY